MIGRPKAVDKGINRRTLPEDLHDDPLAGQVMSGCHLIQDGRQHAGTELRVERDGEVMLRRPRMGEADMAALLADLLLAHAKKTGHERFSGHIARQFHTASSTSLTRCRRTVAGRSSGVKCARIASTAWAFSSSRSSAWVKMSWPNAWAQNPPSSSSWTWKMTSNPCGMRDPSPTASAKPADDQRPVPDSGRAHLVDASENARRLK